MCLPYSFGLYFFGLCFSFPRGVAGVVRALCLGLLLLGLPATGVTRPLDSETTPQDSLRVFVSVPPLLFLVRRLGGERIDVRSMVRAGHMPESYEPVPSQVVGLSEARLFFHLGFPFERRLLRQIDFTAPRLRVVDLAVDLAEDWGRAAGSPGVEPHLWNSPRMAIALARRVTAALSHADPMGAGFYRRQLRTLEKALQALDAEFRVLLSPYRGRDFYVIHPAWGYFARDYGLVQVALEEDGVGTQPRRLVMFLERARAAGARVVFLQPQHHHGIAEHLTVELGVRLVELDPLDEDPLHSWRRLVVALLESWKP